MKQWKVAVFRKYFSVIVGLSLTGLALTACAPPGAGSVAIRTETTSTFSQELYDSLPVKVRESGVLKVGGEPNGPWRVVEGDGQVSGFQTDLLAEFSKILGVKVESDLLSLPNVKVGVQSGRIDVAFGPILDSESTRKDMSVIDYHTARPAFVHLRGTHVASADDLCGHTVAFVDGSAPLERAMKELNLRCSEATLPAPKPLAQSEVNTVVMATLSGRADFAATNVSSAAFIVDQRSDVFDMYISKEGEFKADLLGMAVDAQNVELLDSLHGAWKIVFENGVYAELMNQYNLTEIMLEEPIVSKSMNVK